MFTLLSMPFGRSHSAGREGGPASALWVVRRMTPGSNVDNPTHIRLQLLSCSDFIVLLYYQGEE